MKKLKDNYQVAIRDGGWGTWFHDLANDAREGANILVNAALLHSYKYNHGNTDGLLLLANLLLANIAGLVIYTGSNFLDSAGDIIDEANLVKTLTGNFYLAEHFYSRGETLNKLANIDIKLGYSSEYNMLENVVNNIYEFTLGNTVISFANIAGHTLNNVGNIIECVGSVIEYSGWEI